MDSTSSQKLTFRVFCLFSSFSNLAGFFSAEAVFADYAGVFPDFAMKSPTAPRAASEVGAVAAAVVATTSRPDLGLTSSQNLVSGFLFLFSTASFKATKTGLDVVTRKSAVCCY